MTSSAQEPWVEKYRPRTIRDLVLPERIAQRLAAYVSSPGALPHLLFAGPPGVGKTSSAYALAADLGIDAYPINAASERSLDSVRGAERFASSLSEDGKRKLVIIDEADCLNAQTAQSALRAIMEAMASVCSFILISNDPDRMIRQIRSRTATLDFSLSFPEQTTMAEAFVRRAAETLAAEHVAYSEGDLSQFVRLFAPDWRRVLNELQQSSATGTLLPFTDASDAPSDISALLDHMRRNDVAGIKDWVSVRPGEAASIIRNLYSNAENTFVATKLAGALANLAECASTLNSPKREEMLVVATLARLAAWESVDS